MDETASVSRRALLSTSAAAAAATGAGFLVSRTPAGALSPPDGFDVVQEFPLPIRRLTQDGWTGPIAPGSVYTLDEHDPPVEDRVSQPAGAKVLLSRCGEIAVMHLRMLLGQGGTTTSSADQSVGASLAGGKFKPRGTGFSTVESEGPLAFWGGDFPLDYRPRMPQLDVDPDGQTSWTGTGFIGVQKPADGKGGRWPRPVDHMPIEGGWSYTSQRPDESSLPSGLFPYLTMATIVYPFPLTSGGQQFIGGGSHFHPDKWLIGWRRGTVGTGTAPDILGVRHPFGVERYDTSGGSGADATNGEWPTGTKIFLSLAYEIGPNSPVMT